MSRVNFGAKPLMYPQPVLIIGTYDENGVPNAMNAAWGITTDFGEITISLSDHKTTDNLKVKGAFTVSMATEDQVVPCDYVGVESGRKVPDKFAKAGFLINVSADDRVITDGAVDITKVKPISFDPFGNAYYGVGAKVGNAFKDGMTLK